MIEDLIYDVGMHNGDDTAYYLEKEFQVVAVEANPVLVQRARKRFAHAIAERRLQILNEAIGPETGTGTFWINDDNDEHSSFDREVCERNGSQSRSIEVEYVPFAEILAACGVPYYLKIDIERARDLGYNGFKCIDQTGHNYPPMRHDNESLSGRMRSRLRRLRYL
ncbi:MAG: FkbM family methyltransferase, partial [Planctomycetota bacterium]